MRTQRSLKPVFFALLLISWSMSLPGYSAVSSRTSSTPFSVSARFGLDGLHRIGDWMPVAISLKNNGPPLELTIGVPLDPQPGVWTRVSLPSHSQKRLFLYVPLRGRDFLAKLEEEAMNPNRNPLLRVEAYAGRTLVKRLTFPYQPAPRSTYAVGLVGHDALPRSYFADRSVLIPEAPEPATPASTTPTPAPFRGESYRKLECACYNLAMEDVPDAAAGLESLDCLALTPATLARFSPGQREAVLMWIEQGGGMLLFGGTPDDLNTASVSPLCPVRASGERIVERLPSLAPWVSEFRRREGTVMQELSTGGSNRTIPGVQRLPLSTPLPPLAGRLWLNNVASTGAETVDLSEDGRALLVTQTRGYGGVSYFSLPLTSEQIRQWPGAPDLWLRALSVLVERCQRTRVSDLSVRAVSPPHFTSANLGDDPAVSAFLRRLRGVTPPPKWGVGLIAILYVLVFGPINVWLVRRVRRSERGWLTTPALSVCFALFLLLLCGFQWGAGTSVLTQFSLLECRADATSAREETVFSIFSPVHGRYDFSFNDPCVFLDDKTAEEEERSSPQSPFRARTFSKGQWQPDISANVAEVAERFPPCLEVAQWEQTARATRWRGAPVGVWTLRRLRTTRATALGGSVHLECKRGADGALRECLVRNNTRFMLRDSLLVAGRSRANLGDLAPGETRALAAEQWTVGQPGLPDYSNFAPGLDDSLRELIHQLSVTLIARAGGVTLIARHDQPLLRIETSKSTGQRAFGLLVVHAPTPP